MLSAWHRDIIYILCWCLCIVMFGVQGSHSASTRGVCVAYAFHILRMYDRVSYRRYILSYQGMTILQSGEDGRGYLMKECFDRI